MNLMMYLSVIAVNIPTVPPPTFDYYVFSRVWDPSRGRVIIHGLWPTWRNGSWPQYCQPTPKQPWNYSQLTDLEPELQDRWSDTGAVDTQWWQHEWDKHGTCAVGSPLISSQLQYFATSLWIDMWLGANGRLQAAGGLAKQPFTLQNLTNIFQATPICMANSTGFYHLSELRINVDLQLNTFEPTRDHSGCGNGTSIYL